MAVIQNDVHAGVHLRKIPPTITFNETEKERENLIHTRPNTYSRILKICTRKLYTYCTSIRFRTTPSSQPGNLSSTRERVFPFVETLFSHFLSKQIAPQVIQNSNLTRAVSRIKVIFISKRFLCSSFLYYKNDAIFFKSRVPLSLLFASLFFHLCSFTS